jgi:uncharacterized protein (TIGR03435 family)
VLLGNFLTGGSPKSQRAMERNGQLLLVLLLLAQSQALPQAPDSNPSFDVASVRPGCGTSAPRMESTPGRLILACQTLETVIRLAYGLREYEYSGPRWLHTARYDIVATTTSPQGRSVQLHMLQQLLAGRFKLAIHRETRTLPTYALVVAKSGSKLKPIDKNLPVPFDLYYDFANFEPQSNGTTALHGYVTVGELCDFLYRLVKRPVLDRTGLTGGFEIRLLCAIEGYPGYDISPTVFEAVQSQLGLRLDPGASPIDVVVVDHVEQPSSN